MSTRKRIEKAEERRLEPPPPPPKPDAEREAMLNLLAYRLRGPAWESFKSAGAHLKAHGDPENLDAMQYRTQILLGNILNMLEEKALKVKDLDPAKREQIFCGALLTATRCALYQALWQKCWRVENGEEPYLPPDRDLAAVFNAQTGAAWNPISEDDRRREGRRFARELAELRERQLLEGFEPVESGQKANDLISELFDPTTGNPAQRRRRLEQLADVEEGGM